jgi:DNA-binding transcriptional LysR family regulator
MSNINDTKLRRVDLGLLLVFQELFRRRRATAAAQRLGLTQPAISHALGRLRALTGDPLFVRRPEGMAPTAHAVELAPKVDAILALAGEAFDEAGTFQPSDSRRLFRISANDFAGSLLATPLIERVAAAAPLARLSISFAGGPAAAYRALRNGDLDVALGRFLDVPADCQATRLFDEDYLVVARADHPKIQGGLDLETYVALDHLVVSFAGDLTGSIDQELAARGVSRRVCAALPLFLGAFAAVAGSDFVATAPRRLALRFAAQFGLRTFEPAVPLPPFAVDLLQSRNSVADAGTAWLIEQIRAVLG